MIVMFGFMLIVVRMYVYSFQQVRNYTARRVYINEAWRQAVVHHDASLYDLWLESQWLGQRLKERLEYQRWTEHEMEIISKSNPLDWRCSYI